MTIKLSALAGVKDLREIFIQINDYFPFWLFILFIHRKRLGSSILILCNFRPWNAPRGCCFLQYFNQLFYNHSIKFA